MTQKDLSAAIASNTYLSEKEKSFWTKLLPRMNDGQRARLGEIIMRAQAINWESPLEMIVAFITSVIVGKTA